MITLIFIAYAAVCNSVMDVISFYYDKSVFDLLENPQYWDARISWKNKYIDWDGGDKRRKKWFGIINIHPSFTDAWHLYKSMMVVYLILAIVFYKPIFGLFFDVFLFGITWNFIFTLFYNKLLKT